MDPQLLERPNISCWMLDANTEQTKLEKTDQHKDKFRHKNHFHKKIYIHIYIEKELNDISSHNDENQFSVAAFFFMRFSALPALNHSI